VRCDPHPSCRHRRHARLTPSRPLELPRPDNHRKAPARRLPNAADLPRPGPPPDSFSPNHSGGVRDDNDHGFGHSGIAGRP
jgi:hypothetical protein